MIILKKKSSYVDTAYSSKLFKTTPLFKVSGWHFMVGYSRVYIVINFSLSISPFKFNTFATFKLKMWWYEIASTLNKKKNIKYTNEIEKTTENKIRWNLVLKIFFFLQNQNISDNIFREVSEYTIFFLKHSVNH